jgi:hypothetical protein
MPLLFSTYSHPSPLQFATQSCVPLWLPPLSSIVRLCHHCCNHHCCPPLLLLSATAIFRCRSHHCHSAVSAVSCFPLLSLPVVVCCLILRAVIVSLCRHCLPSSLSTAAIFRHCIHHCYSAVSAVSCRPLLSFPILVHHPILHAVIIHQHHCMPQLLSAVAVIVRHRHLPLPQTSLSLYHLHRLLPPSLTATSSLCQPSLKNLISHHQPLHPFLFCSILSCHLSSTILTPHVTADVACLWQSFIAAIITSPPLVLPTLACSPHHLLPQPASTSCGMVHAWVDQKKTPINLKLRQYAYLKVMFWY